MNNPRLLMIQFITVILSIGIWACPSTPETTPTERDLDQHFYFVQITDTHFGDGDHFARVEKIVDAINELPMEIICVVHTGDITSENITQDSIMTRGMAILKKLKMPIHFVPGNHDIYEDDFDLSLEMYKHYFGELINVNEYHGVQFITLYTEPLVYNFQVNDYNPMMELETTLKDGNGKPALVFHHSPSAGDFYNNAMHDSWEKSAIPPWIELLNSYNVKAVMTGHYHRDEYHWLGEVPLFVSDPVGSWYGRQGSFRIYEYNNGKLSYTTQYINMKPWRSE